jgi:uncharacterized protein YkwD
MSNDWLQLTEEDIRRAHQLGRGQRWSAETIIITPADIPDGEVQQLHSSRSLVITVDDLGPADPQSSTIPDLRALEQQMCELVNEARKKHLPGWIGTARLEPHDGLTAVARGHAMDMLRRQYVAHVTPEGVTASRRIEMQGIGYVACGENIGVYYGSTAHTQQAVTEIHQAFMNQPRNLTNHRGNLLNPLWTHLGIGIAYNPSGTLIATQNFISAPVARLRRR